MPRRKPPADDFIEPPYVVARKLAREGRDPDEWSPPSDLPDKKSTPPARKKPGRKPKTYNVPADADAFADLLPQELVFIEAKLAGANNTDAYIKSHPEHKSSQDRTAAARAAFGVLQRPRVQAALAELRRKAIMSIQTLDEWMSRTIALEQKATDMNQLSAAVRALTIQAQAMGWIGSGTTERTPEQPLEPGELVLSVRAKLGEDAARRLAQQVGLVDLSPPPAPHEMKDVTPHD